MTASLLRLLAVSGALAFVFATSTAHAQVSLSSGLQSGGEIPSGQPRSWAFNVPAGNYLAIGRVTYRLTGDADGAGFDCMLKRGSTDEFWDIADASASGVAGQTIEGEMTLISQVPMPTDGMIAIQCRAEGGQTQRIQNVVLELIQVRVFRDLTRIDTSGPTAPVRDPPNRGAAERHQ
jgi:hypothetical protein